MPMKAYKYRIYPTKAQITKFEQWLDICCELYNAALQERRDAWCISRKSISRYDQFLQIREIREIREDVKSMYVAVLRDALTRVDLAFQSYFRRVREGEKCGYPRFRSRSRYNSFTYSHEQGFKVDGSKLKLSKIGYVKVKMHRPVEGEAKTLTVSRSATGKWYACVIAKIEPVPLEPSKDRVGIDCGIDKLAALSTGEFIENPRFFRRDERALAKVQRKESVAVRGSKSYAKRHKVVARIHVRITNRRANFAHQESRKLVNRFGFIAFENLSIRNMLKNHKLAKSISDAAWNQLITFTTYKAAWAGRSVVLVDPRNTSRKCSNCGKVVKKELSECIHNCDCCGLSLNRDINAARNILALGLQMLGDTPKSLSKDRGIATNG